MECCSNEMNSNSFFKKPLLHYSITPALLVLAEEFHDIAPPVDYSLIPTWLIFVASFIALSLIGGLIWWFIQRRRKRGVPPQLPRDRALAALGAAANDIDTINPYQFSIR